MAKGERNDSLIMTLFGLAIVIGAFIFILILFNGTKKESQVFAEGDKIVIKGQYGITYDIEDVTEIKLGNDIPPIGKKVNGAGLGEIKKGNFDVEGLGTCRLFIHSDNGPFIYITVDGQYAILNFKDPNKTKAVYEELMQAFK